MLNVIFQRAGKEYLSDDVIHSTFQLIRSSPPEVFCKKGVLKNFAKLTGKHLCQRLWHWCFPVTFAKVLRTALFIEHLQWLLLMAISCLMCQTLCFYANKSSSRYVRLVIIILFSDPFSISYFNTFPIFSTSILVFQF